MELNKLLVIVFIVVLVSCGSPVSYMPEGSVARDKINIITSESNDDSGSSESDDVSVKIPYYQVENRPSIEVSLLNADFSHACWHFPDKNLLAVPGNYSTETGLMFFYNFEGKYLYTINLNPILSKGYDASFGSEGLQMYDVGSFIFLRKGGSLGLIDPARPDKELKDIASYVDYYDDKSYVNRMFITITLDDANNFYCSIDKDTEKIVWKGVFKQKRDFDRLQARFCSVVGFNEILVILYQDYTYCINKNNGDIIWQRDNIFFSDERSHELKPTKQGVVYAWNMQVIEGWDHNPVFEGRTTTMSALSIYSGKTLWQLEYPSISDDYVFRSNISDEKMLFIVSSGIYEISHTKGILRRYEKNNCRFTQDGWQYNGRVYSLFLKAPSWYKEPQDLKYDQQKKKVSQNA